MRNVTGIAGLLIVGRSKGKEARRTGMRAFHRNAGLRVAGLALGASAMFMAGFASAEQSAPHDYRGVDEKVLASIDLAGEIDTVQDRQLRLSRAVIAPGGHVGLHSHQGDPTIVYMLSGVLTNHHDDGTVQEFDPGEVFAEFGPRRHWVENRGTAPVIFIVANIHRKE
jgi:quercetin dioxygenase-like cupin family protein